MCSQIRRPWGLVCLAAFLAHIADRLGRFDPFHAASRRIPAKH